MKLLCKGLPLCSKCYEAHYPISDGQKCPPVPILREKIPKRICNKCQKEFKAKEDWKKLCITCYKIR